MNWFSSLSIQIKILVIPVVGAIGFCIYLMTSLVTMSQTQSLLTNAYKVEFRLLTAAESALVGLDKIKETLANAATMGESELVDKAQETATEINDELLAVASLDPDSGRFVRAWLADFDDYLKQASQLSNQMINGTADFDKLADNAAKINNQFESVKQDVKNFQSARLASFNQAFESVVDKTESTAQTGIVIGIVTIAVLFAVAIPISLITKRSLAELIASMKDIAQENGDLTVRIKTQSQDEIGELVHWFNSFIEKLQKVIKNVVDTAGPVADTAHRIQGLSNQTIASFEKQSSAVVQSRQSVQEMSHSVADITRNAADAADAANNANNEAEQGREVVQQTVDGIKDLETTVTSAAETINQLQEDTNRVNVVLDVIKGIAEQTNLLALNAAIEAARAGEQGRGFAVVADEVRNLASRTQESTEEINQMLEQLQSAAGKAVEMMDSSRSRVEASVESANQAGDRLTVITSTVNTISDMNGAIAVATEQQNTVAGLMVEQVEDIQHCADEASTASNEIASVSNQLNELAAELADVTSKFKV
ncbi:methyl-accepting chemotaxis protein [Thalassotalea sp. LPB0316]|uniref:methyl-accepting chemotaxis protein n=1 Tax=Thalassotalea sp. LPB0316 TaxID=2769490 RepID=UPI001868BC2D|nr:methyl-accepting chemotaxis protein [Thalassotalea sp. LPB0316]QOL27127.1 methyl-accepting chemotaxis protein [Thalassotalea sp. LPB0316]